MALSLFSILVPYLVESAGAASGTAPSSLVEVDSIATEQASAVKTAQQLVQAWLQMRYPGQQARLNGTPTCAGNAKSFDGPFGYVFRNTNVITSLPFPKRLNGDPSEKLGHLLASLDEKEVYAVIIDCTHLAHINSVGLTSIAAHVKRLRLHLFHVQASVKRVIDVVGLAPLISIHPDLTAALKGAVERVTRKS